jgi:hypothetical protein
MKNHSVRFRGDFARFQYIRPQSGYSARNKIFRFWAVFGPARSVFGQFGAGFETVLKRFFWPGVEDFRPEGRICLKRFVSDPESKISAPRGGYAFQWISASGRPSTQTRHPGP